MKKIYQLATALILFIYLASCTGTHRAKNEEYAPATQELIQLVESDPEVKSMLEASIKKAAQINPDEETNPAQNLEEYYQFVSYCETAIPWTLQQKSDYPEIFDNMFQSLLCFYFIIDQPLPELEDKGYFNNTLQYSKPIGEWLIRFSQSWGRFLDTEDSWNEEYYQMALNDSAFGLQQGWYEDPSNWKTFNQFFARKLATPDQRPIAAPEDPTVVVSFADSKPQGTWPIDQNSNIVSAEGVPVKSATIRSVEQLIGEQSMYNDSFAGGTFTHSFLNVNDYHWYHFPLGGTVKEARIIQGINPTGGSLSWDAENNRYAFDPSSVGWQSIETRGCVILDTGDYGLVAILPIGMGAVGSVNFLDHIKPGAEVKKGDPLGYFLFGGSDFVMVFQGQVDFTIDSPKEESGDSLMHLLVGERLGYMTKK